MWGGFEPSLTFLNQQVPLWFALLMAFSSPYMWSEYVKSGVERVLGQILGREE
jgi:hypothetical protein